MKKASAVDGIRHVAFEDATGTALHEARISDRQRLGILLQGLALMAALDEAGWRLPRGWAAAKVSRNGLLRLPKAVPGARSGLPQEQMRELVRALFGSHEEIAGRGQARRLVRLMLERWQQGLTPVQPSKALARLFLEASVLWEPAFGAARGALMASFRRGKSWELWFAGGQPFREALLERAEGWDEAMAILGSPEARLLYRTNRLYRAHRPYRTHGLYGETESGKQGANSENSAWQVDLEAEARQSSPAGGSEGRLVLARELFRQGRFERALELLARARTLEARLLRTQCQLWLSEVKAAAASLRKLEKRVEEPAQVLEAAEIAVDVFSKLGDFDAQQEWASRALELSRRTGPLFPRAQILAATAAWDRGDEDAAERYLAESESARDHPELARRWLRVRALQSLSAGDGEGLVGHLAQILRHHRRSLLPFEAAVLWNDLGIGRAQLGDLPGAERAFLHAHRLMERCDGPRKENLALFNLAEIRLRRGRLVGVRAALERASANDRNKGRSVAVEYDDELWARYELVLGRPSAALSHLRRAQGRDIRSNIEHRRQELAVLEARALGLLGRPVEAAAKLRDISPGALSILEPEERPAVYALAGLRQEALTAAADTELESWWFGVLSGGASSEREWNQLNRLERYRAARLVHDAELLQPGSAPPRWRRRAAETFYRVGATGQARVLEARDQGPWKTLESFLAKGSFSTEDVGTLFAEVGYTDAGLFWKEEGGAEGLLWGSATGKEERVEQLTKGSLILRCDALDPVVEALFQFAVRAFEPTRRTPSRPPAGGMLGESPKLMVVLERLKKLARTEVPVLVLGESGTGKELAARHLHRSSDRRDGPFVPLNCAALSEHLVLSDLFGHVKGSFTGADRDRAGVFETARGGTVFLDEVGDLPLSAQVNLLRVLQEREVRRLGESVSRAVDVRVVAATHRDLVTMVAEKTFRQDLYYRLRVGSLSLPPLRERGRDVEILAETFLAEVSLENERPGVKLSAQARALLLSHHWPGNVRELRNVLSLAVALSDTDVIDAEHLDIPKKTVEIATDYHASLRTFRRKMIVDALDGAAGNQAEAARRLGLTRQALAYQIKQLGLETS